MLLNKATWRDPSADLREIWTPTAGAFNPDGGQFIVKGTAPVTSGTILDEYGAFPMDFSVVIDQRPSNWWPQQDGPLVEDGEVRAPHHRGGVSHARWRGSPGLQRRYGQ